MWIQRGILCFSVIPKYFEKVVVLDHFIIIGFMTLAIFLRITTLFDLIIHACELVSNYWWWQLGFKAHPHYVWNCYCIVAHYCCETCSKVPSIEELRKRFLSIGRNIQLQMVYKELNIDKLFKIWHCWCLLSYFEISIVLVTCVRRNVRLYAVHL